MIRLPLAGLASMKDALLFSLRGDGCGGLWIPPRLDLPFVLALPLSATRTEFYLTIHVMPSMLYASLPLLTEPGPPFAPPDLTEIALCELSSCWAVSTSCLISWIASTTPLRPIHLKAGLRLFDIWVLWIRPIDCSTFAMSYNLRIFVLRSFSSKTSPSEIYLAASSRLRTSFQVTKRRINCWQKLPSDLTFLYLAVFLELRPVAELLLAHARDLLLLLTAFSSFSASEENTLQSSSSTFELLWLAASLLAEFQL